MYSIVVHGGAGIWEQHKESQALAGVRSAVEAGIHLLAKGESALDAVIAAVVAMEDDPIFNAGTGSVLNLDGEAEMDACVMSGTDMRAGAVTCLCRVKNPILVARRVMDETDHILLAGEGALRFARAKGFPDHDPMTSERLADYQRHIQHLSGGLEDAQRALHVSGNTVGAVALGKSGDLAAATSTGGLVLKMPGRVGDTPVLGAGNYATGWGAASATGLGELIMRFLATKTVCDLIEAGQPAQAAVSRTLTGMVKENGKEVGVIAVDAQGCVGIGHCTLSMPHAFYQSGELQLICAMRTEHLVGFR